MSERPVWFSGVRLRTRTTVLRLDDGGLLVHSPPDPTDAFCAALLELGEVRFIVVPNAFHHLGARAAAARFPSARVVGPRSATARNPSLQLHIELRDDAFLGAVRELDAISLDGCPFLDETVFFHRPTGSLIGADVAMSACARDHWTWRWAGRITGCYDRVRTPPDVRAKTPRNDAAARSIDRMASLPLKRLSRRARGYHRRQSGRETRRGLALRTRGVTASAPDHGVARVTSALRARARSRCSRVDRGTPAG